MIFSSACRSRRSDLLVVPAPDIKTLRIESTTAPAPTAWARPDGILRQTMTMVRKRMLCQKRHRTAQYSRPRGGVGREGGGGGGIWIPCLIFPALVPLATLQICQWCQRPVTHGIESTTAPAPQRGLAPTGIFTQGRSCSVPGRHRTAGYSRPRFNNVIHFAGHAPNWSAGSCSRIINCQGTMEVRLREHHRPRHPPRGLAPNGILSKSVT